MWIVATLAVAFVAFMLGGCFGFLIGAFYRGDDYDYSLPDWDKLPIFKSTSHPIPPINNLHKGE